MSKAINIICPDNGVGLSRDRKIIADLLKGHAVTFSEAEHPQDLRARYDLNIFLEVVYPEYLALAKKNVLVPNPEWFYPHWHKYLYRFAKIFCKTKDCEKIFSALHKDCVFTSFTSEDRYLDVPRQKTFAHFVGRSSHKGTKQVILASYRGVLPRINIFSNEKQYELIDANRIAHRRDRIPDERFQKLQNEHQFHICTSEYEGFGHYINEARSCGAIIITTNHAPMNELVTDKIGFGVCFDKVYKHNLAELAVPNAEQIAQCIQYAASMDDVLIKKLSKRSRQAFLSNDKFFKEKFLSEINNVIN